MEAWKQQMYADELYHHGILGMKWGKMNGPPYPIGSGDHSASEKKAGWKKSLNGKNPDEYDRKKSKSSSEKKEFHLTDEQKRRIKIGVTVAASALAAYGAYKIATNPKVQDLVKAGMNQMKNPGGVNNSGPDNSILEGHFTKNENFVHDISKDFSGINPNYKNTDSKFQMLSDLPDKSPLAEVNCVACTTSYELKCRGYSNITAQLTDTRKLPFNDLMTTLYKNPQIEGSMFNDYKQLAKELAKQGNGARGNLILGFQGGGGHSIAYEVVKGKTVFMDCQMGKSFNSIEELSKALIDANNGKLEAGISKIPVAKWVRTDNLEFADIETLKKLCNG